MITDKQVLASRSSCQNMFLSWNQATQRVGQLMMRLLIVTEAESLNTLRLPMTHAQTAHRQRLDKLLNSFHCHRPAAGFSWKIFAYRKTIFFRKIDEIL